MQPCSICLSPQSKKCNNCRVIWYCQVCVADGRHPCAKEPKKKVIPNVAAVMEPCSICLSPQSIKCDKCRAMWCCRVCAADGRHQCDGFDAKLARSKFIDHSGAVYGRTKKPCVSCFSPKSKLCNICFQDWYCTDCRKKVHDKCTERDEWYIDEYGEFLWRPLWTKAGEPGLGDTIPVLLRPRTAAMIAANCNGCAHQHNDELYLIFLKNIVTKPYINCVYRCIRSPPPLYWTPHKTASDDLYRLFGVRKRKVLNGVWRLHANSSGMSLDNYKTGEGTMQCVFAYQ